MHSLSTAFLGFDELSLSDWSTLSTISETSERIALLPSGLGTTPGTVSGSSLVSSVAPVPKLSRLFSTSETKSWSAEVGPPEFELFDERLLSAAAKLLATFETELVAFVVAFSSPPTIVSKPS